MCGSVRLVEDDENLIYLRCDNHEHENFHKDSIHELFWPIEETHVHSVKPPDKPVRWTYEEIKEWETIR